MSFLTPQISLMFIIQLLLALINVTFLLTN